MSNVKVKEIFKRIDLQEADATLKIKQRTGVLRVIEEVK